VIVDDHDGFRLLARALLESQGFTVLGEAADGGSAIETVTRLDPDVVLLDVALPDLDGFAVCERILGASGQRPQIVLTSTREPSAFRTRLAGSRATAFIAKRDLTGAALLGLLTVPR
jgi:CheY-like chemotaxis protein